MASSSRVSPSGPSTGFYRRGKRDGLWRQARDRRDPLKRPGNAVFELAFTHPPGEPPLGGASARVEELTVRIEGAEHDGNGDKVGVMEAGHELGRLAFVRGAVDADAPIRPGLRRYPGDDLAVVRDLTLCELAGPGPERRSGAAGVDHDQREAGPVPQIPGSDVGVRLRFRPRRRVRTVIAGSPDDRSDPAACGDLLDR
jgi:hypothetical protein